jgi:hypothetical protein
LTREKSLNKIIQDFARLYAVEIKETTGQVWVKFEVMDPKYREFAMRIAQRDDIIVTFVGERIDIELESEEDI